MNKKENFKFIFLISFLILFLTGCSLQEENQKTIQDKTNEEISYIEDEIFTIVNKYIRGEYNDDTGGIKWDDVNKEVQNLNSVLDTIMLDLSELEITNDELVNLRNEVNNLSISVTNKDDYNLLQKSSYIYSLLPTYMEKYSQDKNKIDNMKLKSLVLSALVQANFLEWDTAKNTALLVENKYKEMMDNVDYMKEYSYNLNKTYILIGEFKNAIDLEEVELTKQKYINFIDKF
ncbi:MAG TPA: hypothetical protein IAD08_07880 [Candidatus Scatovivens faecipullorum]|nr:hypothetical protein [Candidatus Scatovivens faecipullorum]